MVSAGGLRSSAFKGDEDNDALRAFFQPEVQFSGDTLWSFGTSLKSAYVNSFEFMNHAPVVQLWRDDADDIQAVSRLSLGTGEWFHLAAPRWRTNEVIVALVQQADAAMALLTDHDGWDTVRYESKADDISVLEASGYVRTGRSEVYMTRSLVDPVAGGAAPSDVEIRLLDVADPVMVRARAMAQVDAFSGGSPTEAEQAWITRSLPHQLSYSQHPGVVATDRAGAVLAFADPFLDYANKIGEFEPVGTRTDAQRKGLSKAVLRRGLQEMRDLGMTTAVVRTGVDNGSAIAAYQAVGFETSDHLVRYRKHRSPLRAASRR